MPDTATPRQSVSFDTTGHRGFAFQNSINEWHILAISQAIFDYHKRHGVGDPLFLGIDTHFSYRRLPEHSKRETSFYVGSKMFDPNKVGFESNQDGNHFLFKTVDDKGGPIPGNSNKGHSGNSFTKTLAEDGQWRDFTDDERYQLIEYMKTL